MIKHIRKELLKTNTWSGGTTTQLFIYPEQGDYKSLNFGYRMSTASVDVESSTFSLLPGINRLIMSLTGPLELTHEGHYSVLLEPFEVDTFMGDWQTVSKGKVIDFNIMSTDDYTTSMRVETVNQTIELTVKDTIAIYAFDQSTEVIVDWSNA